MTVLRYNKNKNKSDKLNYWNFFLVAVFAILFFGMTLFDDAQAMKSKGNSLTEVSSKQVCGNFLCDEPLSIAEKITVYLLTLAQQEETETEILQQAAVFPNMKTVTKKSDLLDPRDVARTPTGPSPVPMPYPNIADYKVPKASKLAAKLIDKYDLKQERLTVGVKKSIDAQQAVAQQKLQDSFTTRGGTSPTEDNLVTVTVDEPFVSRTTQNNFLIWLNNWDKMSSVNTIPTELKNSSLDLYDENGKLFASLNYDEIIPISYTPPSVDASGKDSLVESFSFKISNKYFLSDISAATILDKGSNSALQVSNFRVELGGLPTTHVFKVVLGDMKASEDGKVTFENWERCSGSVRAVGQENLEVWGCSSSSSMRTAEATSNGL